MTRTASTAPGRRSPRSCAVPFLSPAPEELDAEQHDDRHHGQREGDDITRVVLSLVERPEDVQRRGLGLPGDRAADDQDGPDLADRPGGAQGDAVEQAPSDVRQRDPEERLQLGGPQGPPSPNSRTAASPTTTGDTASGRSTRALTTALPGKRSRERTSDTTTPSTVVTSRASTVMYPVSR